MLDFYLKNQLFIFVVVSFGILYAVRFANNAQLLNAIILITIVYYVFFSKFGFLFFRSANSKDINEITLKILRKK